MTRFIFHWKKNLNGKIKKKKNDISFENFSILGEMSHGLSSHDRCDRILALSKRNIDRIYFSAINPRV